MADNLDYFESEDFREILEKYETSVKSGQSLYMDADDLADIADFYQYNGRMEEAENAIELAFQYNPEAIGPLLYKAREALSANDFKKAREYTEHIKATDTLEGLYFEGEILICEGKTEEADQLFREQFKEMMPDEQMDYVYDVANVFSDYNIFDKAFEWIARSQGDDSNDFKELMARTLFGLGKYKDSERIFNELIDHNPYSKRYWNALASAQFMNEDYGAAITSSEFAIAIDPEDTDSILSKANSLYNLDNFESALDYFRKYSEKMPDDEFGYLHQGTCLINMERYEEAIEALERAKETAAKDSQYLPDIYQELAFAYSEHKDPETALYYLDQTTALNCDHINMEIVRGHILLSNKRLKEAEDTFKGALQMSGNAPMTMLRIIVSLYDNRYVNSSYSLMKKFFNYVDEDWTDGFAYMALCCLDIKKYDEFLHYLRIAIDKNPKETRMVLGSYIPKGMELNEYYDYILNKIKEQES